MAHDAFIYHSDSAAIHPRLHPGCGALPAAVPAVAAAVAASATCFFFRISVTNSFLFCIRLPISTAKSFLLMHFKVGTLYIKFF